MFVHSRGKSVPPVGNALHQASNYTDRECDFFQEQRPGHRPGALVLRVGALTHVPAAVDGSLVVIFRGSLALYVVCSSMTTPQVSDPAEKGRKAACPRAEAPSTCPGAVVFTNLSSWRLNDP